MRLPLLLGLCVAWAFSARAEEIVFQRYGCAFTPPAGEGWRAVSQEQHPPKCVYLTTNRDDTKKIALYAYPSSPRMSLRGAGKEEFLQGYTRSLESTGLSVTGSEEVRVGEYEGLRVEAAPAQGAGTTVSNLLVARGGTTYSLVGTSTAGPAGEDPEISAAHAGFRLIGTPQGAGTEGSAVRKIVMLAALLGVIALIGYFAFGKPSPAA